MDCIPKILCGPKGVCFNNAQGERTKNFTTTWSLLEDRTPLSGKLYLVMFGK